MLQNFYMIGRDKSKCPWRFDHIYRKWVFWPVEADTWRKQIHWWTKVCHYLLRNRWYVDWSMHSCILLNYQCYNSAHSGLLLQGSSNFWGLITCWLSRKEDRLVWSVVIMYMPSPKVQWFRFQILLFGPVSLILRMRTGLSPFCM